MDANNNQKMREALEFAYRQLTTAIEDDEVGGNVLYLAGCMRVVANKCRAALSAPPRNCDMFETKEEAAEAYAEECNTCIPQSVLWQMGEWLDWLFAEAKGETK